MKIIESTIERLAWYLVFILFAGQIVGLVIGINVLHNLKQQTLDFHNQNIDNQVIIKQNQVNETQAIKQYIACLLTLNPQGPSPLSAQELVCFNQVPKINP